MAPSLKMCSKLSYWIWTLLNNYTELGQKMACNDTTIFWALNYQNICLTPLVKSSKKKFKNSILASRNLISNLRAQLQGIVAWVITEFPLRDVNYEQSAVTLLRVRFGQPYNVMYICNQIVLYCYYAMHDTVFIWLNAILLIVTTLK